MNITDEALRQAAASLREAMSAALPAPEDCHHDFSPAFLRKMNRLLRRQKHPKIYRLLHQAAAIFLAFLVGAGTWLTVNEEARADFVQWVKEIYETHIIYRFSGSTAKVEVYRPTWIPAGYQEHEIIGPPENTMVTYLNGDNLVLSFLYTTLQQGNHTKIDLKDFSVSNVTINGISGEFYLSANPQVSNNLYWVDTERNVSFALTGFLDKTVMVHIAESIYLSESTK